MTDAQSLIITQATNAGSSSAEAYALAFPSNHFTNSAFNNYTYVKSSATVKKTYSTNSYEVLNPTSADLHTRGQYTYGYPSTTINGNTTTNISEAAAFALKYPTNPYLHGSGSHGHTNTIKIPANITFDDFLTGSINQYVTQSVLENSSVSPKFNIISASKFTTTYSNGNVLVIGDDTKIVDVNLSNGMAIVGQQQNNRGWVKFGTGGPLWGHNGNQSTLPTPGDGLYTITGSLIVSASKLMFYNGDSAGTNGWVAIK